MIRFRPLWRILLAAGLALAGATVPNPANAAVNCSATWLCEGFETQTGTPAGRWTVSFRDCSGTGSAVTDQTVAHTGTRSLRINGGGGYCNHVFVGTPLTGVISGAELYARFWVRHSTALPPAHVTFAAMRDSNDANKDIRIGGQNQALQWNRESDDATLPEQSPAGVALSHPLPLTQWTCVELHLSLAAGQLQTFVDDALVTGLVVDGTPTHDIDSQWLRRANWRPQPTDLRLGWESYGGETDTLWFDDLVLNSSRIGCA
jgi:hypothetical protein